MVRVNTSFLLGGGASQAAEAIVVPSSPELPSFQRQFSSSPSDASIFDRSEYVPAETATETAATTTTATAAGNTVDDVILVPSTPDSFPASRPQSNAKPTVDVQVLREGSKKRKPARSNKVSHFFNHDIPSDPPAESNTAQKTVDKPGEPPVERDGDGSATTSAVDLPAEADMGPPPEPALRRRQDWTPPPADTIVLDSDSPSAAMESWSSPSRHASETRQWQDQSRVFRSLRDSFTCQEESANPAQQPDQPNTAGEKKEALGKRRAIEMVPGPVGPGNSVEPPKSPSPAKAKPKAPRRKPRTITELAVAAYATPESMDDASCAPAPVVSGQDGAASLKTSKTATKGRAGTGRRAAGSEPVINPGLPLTKARKLKTAQPKAKGGKAKGAAKGKKTAVRDMVLLSPRSAMVESSVQDFVFGTSSQLAGNESPTFLRSLHAAMQSSNQVDGAFPEGVDHVDLSSLHSMPATTVTSLASRSSSRLWTVGARNEGQLARDHVVDIGEVSFPIDPEAVVRAQFAVEAQATQQHIAQMPKEPKKTQPHQLASTSSLGGCLPAISSLEPLPALLPQTQSESKNMNKNMNTNKRPASASPKRQIKRSNDKSSKLDQPGLQTDAVSQSSCGPLKKQGDLPPLRLANAGNGLQSQSLQSQQNQQNEPPTGRAALHTSSRVEAAAKSATSRSRATKSKGRAESTKTKKPSETVKEKPVVFEIQDSDSDGGRLSPPPAMASAPASQLDNAEDDDSDIGSGSDGNMDQQEGDADTSLALAPTGEDTELFAYITRAVLAAPRTDDPTQPSWHEKMLMYDTIILETFTAWLNDGPLATAGYEGKDVDPHEIKRWCQSKSVCCTWKYNLHGKERKW